VITIQIPAFAGMNLIIEESPNKYPDPPAGGQDDVGGLKQLRLI
jgi:hypothetical protein